MKLTKFEKNVNKFKFSRSFAGIKSQLETLLKSCWHMTATKRPTASEIAELLSNNPRLISPCIDVPLASVQVERTDSLELIPSVSIQTSLGRTCIMPRKCKEAGRGRLDGASHKNVGLSGLRA